MRPDGRPATKERRGGADHDPALENAGWHNSTKFPVAADNPLNGNMYRPLYFYHGQAIHGLEQRPAGAAEQGLSAVRVEDQDTLIGWLGLTEVTGPILGPGIASTSR